MSLAGYLNDGKPRERETGWSVDRLKTDALGLMKPQEPVYEQMAQYDPVLRAHCRLDED